jgi:dihydroorotate dehydrogenase
VHHAAAGALEGLLASPVARAALRRRMRVESPVLHSRIWGIDFPDPVGLAAGFDKGGTMFNAVAALGFGFVEIGTVTARAQPGNPRPRLFRLPDDCALLNRLGFNNPGADAVAARLGRVPIEPVLGVNLGKSKVTPLEEATDDYLYSLERLERFADYLVVNVSSPNTPGLRELQEAEPLRELLRALHTRAAELARDREAPARPILLKIAPDLSESQINRAVDIAAEEGCAGIVATNTTVSRQGLRTPAAEVERLGSGGISGAPLRERATAVLRQVYRRVGTQLPIVGVGGIFDADDAWARLRAGASLIQLYTGFIYGGPAVAREINLGLLHRMEREGVRSLSEVVGSAER